MRQTQGINHLFPVCPMRQPLGSTSYTLGECRWLARNLEVWTSPARLLGWRERLIMTIMCLYCNTCCVNATSRVRVMLLLGNMTRTRVTRSRDTRTRATRARDA